MKESPDQRRDEIDDAIVEGLIRTDFGRRVDVAALLERAAHRANRPPLDLPWWRQALPLVAAAAVVLITATGAFHMGAGLSAGLSGMPQGAATPWGSLEERARFAFAHSTGGREVMSRNTLRLILVVSLIFNAGFIGGFLYVRSIIGALNTPEGRIELIGQRMGVAAPIRAICVTIEQERIIERKRILASEKQGIDSFYAEAMKDQPDMERLRTMVDAGMALHRRLLLNDLEHLARIAARLDPKQRATMMAILRNEDLFAE